MAADAAGNASTASSQVSAVITADTTAPDVSISAPAAGAALSGTVTLTATASDDVGVQSVQFRVDGNNVGAADTTSPYSVSLDTTTLSTGSHTISAVARDAAGNTKTSANVSVTVDNAAPTVAISAPANGATLSGTATAHRHRLRQRGVQSVQFQVDGNNVGAADTTSPYSLALDTATLSSGAHTISAVARDAAGNTKTSANVSVTVDKAAPDVSISAPAAGAALSGTTTLTATASDDVGVQSVQFRVDGNNVGAADTTSPYSVSLDTTTLSTGSHTISAVARDAAGNTKTSANVSVTVDNTAPTVSLSAPAAGSLVAGTTTLTATASDNVGVQSVQFRVDGNNVGAADTTSPYSLSLDTTTLSNGSHTLSAVARDAAGNTRTSANVTITVDNAAPTVAISAPANGATLSGTTTITATASDNVAVQNVQFLVDGCGRGHRHERSLHDDRRDQLAVRRHARAERDRTRYGGQHADLRERDGHGGQQRPDRGHRHGAQRPATIVSGTTTVSATASDAVGVQSVQFRVDGNERGHGRHDEPLLAELEHHRAHGRPAHAERRGA